MLAKAGDGFGTSLFVRQDLAQLIAESLDETKRWHKRDCPLAAPFVVFFVLSMALSRSLSIKSLLIQLFIWMRAAAPRLSLRAVTPEALCHARARLGSEPLKALFGKLAAQIMAPASFLGLRAWAVDGVHLTLPDTPANEGAFGRPSASRGSAAFPQMLVVALVETTTRLIRDIVIGKTDDPERSGCEKLLAHLDGTDLLMMDRGFAAVWLFDRILNRKIHFLSRFSNSWKPTVLSRLGPGDWLVQVTGPNCSPRETQRQKPEGGVQDIVLTLRMIEYTIGNNERVRLLTDLLDPVQYPARELAVGYHLRWECELSYDELKTHLATVNQGALHTVLRSKSPDGLVQEVYGLFIAYNLVRALMQEAGEQNGIPPIEISFTETLQVIRNALPEFERAKPEDLARLGQRLLADIAECRLDRPRRKRGGPRVIKDKMSNWKLKRPGDQHRAVDHEADLRLGA
jgi:hypothetical protein